MDLVDDIKKYSRCDYLFKVAQMYYNKSLTDNTFNLTYIHYFNDFVKLKKTIKNDFVRDSLPSELEKKINKGDKNE